MNRSRLLHRWVPFFMALLCLVACIEACGSNSENPRQARSGTWHGETAFGSFSFTVCEGGRNITSYTLEYTVGGLTQALGGSEVHMNDDDGSFDLSKPEAGVTFQGQFSADGKSAGGVWEIAASRDTVSEEWAIER